MDQPFEVTDFSGGITDNYVDSDINTYRDATNLYIRMHGKQGKLLSRPGSAIYDGTTDSTSTGTLRPDNSRTVALKYFDNERLLSFNDRKVWHQATAGAAWTAIAGPTGNNLFTSAANTNVVPSIATWNRHLFVASSDNDYVSKIYPTRTSDTSTADPVYKLRTAGLPKIDESVITLTAETVGAAKTYLYKFVYTYSYSVGTVAFLDVGAPTESKSVQTLNDIGATPNRVLISTIPVLSNGANTNWDTTVIKVEIYRTINNGTVFYKSGEITNGTTTYNDAVTDTALQTNTLLYTEDGSQPNDLPPRAKIVHVDDNFCYYANTLEGSERRKNRIYQSIPGDLDSVPATFYRDLDDDIIGVSSFKGNIIAFCSKFIYRIEGKIDTFGRGDMTPVRISDNAGCISSASVVQGLEGVFWAGNDGFYWSDGYQVQKLTHDLEARYAARVVSATQRQRITGRYDSYEKRVYWSATSASTITEVDEVWVLHLEWGLRHTSSFTIWDGKSTFFPSAIEVVAGDLYRGDRYGYILRHQDSLGHDDKIANGVLRASWVKEAIVYNYVGFATSFTGNFVRKMATRIVITAKALSPLSLQLVSNNDDSKQRLDLKYIRDRSVFQWGDEDVIWGDPNLVWNKGGLIQEQRRFPAKSLRFAFKQMEITNAFVPIVSSAFLGNLTVDSTAKTAVFENAMSQWPTQSVDYYIAFETDGYVNEYLVTSRSTTTIVFADAGNSCPNGSGIGFVMRGIPKGEFLQLMGYCIHWQQFGKTQSPYTASESGEP